MFGHFNGMCRLSPGKHQQQQLQQQRTKHRQQQQQQQNHQQNDDYLKNKLINFSFSKNKTNLTSLRRDKVSSSINLK